MIATIVLSWKIASSPPYSESLMPPDVRKRGAAARSRRQGVMSVLSTIDGCSISTMIDWAPWRSRRSGDAKRRRTAHCPAPSHSITDRSATSSRVTELASQAAKSGSFKDLQAQLVHSQCTQKTSLVMSHVAVTGRFQHQHNNNKKARRRKRACIFVGPTSLLSPLQLGTQPRE